nr:MAG TPA: hypothetical protein [Caudoviricetes sp.]
MTIKQYAELLEYIFKNNGWNIDAIMDSLDCGKPMIKYVNSSFDTRDGHIWSIKLSGISATDKSFRVETDEEVAKVYEWLNKERK